MDGEQLNFGRFCLDLGRRRLLRDQKPVRLGSRALDILCVLASAEERVVSKDQLMERVWPGVVVEENNLHVHISALRRVLAEEDAGQTCLVTVPGRGYRLVGLQNTGQQATLLDPVEEAEKQAALDGNSAKALEDSSRPTQVQSHELYLCCPGKPSIAVLAFSNWSGDPQQEYFTDGIAEDIITALSRYSSLFVIARSSSFNYKGRPVDARQVGCELGVRYILEGGMRKSGNRIRITAQLVDAENGMHIWAERYDRDVADIFAVQDEITEAVTIAIAPAIAEAERRRAMHVPPGSLDAWVAYQRGLWHFYKISPVYKTSPSENALAQSYFQQAIDIDPNFAAGYKGLASVYSQSGAFGTHIPGEAYASAEALARKAVVLDPTDAEAHAILATARLRHGDHEGALAAAKTALAMSPNLALANGTLGETLIFSGRPKEGLAAVEISIRLDPHDPKLANRLNNLAAGLYFSQEYEAALEEAKRAVRANPDFALAYRWLAASLGQLGRTAEAKKALEKAITIAPATFDMYVRQRVPWHRQQDYDHMIEGLRKAGWKG